MNKRVLTVVLAVLLFMTGFVRAGAASYHEGEVEEYILQQLAAANIPGVSLSIVTSQKEIYSVAFGDVKETSSDLQICALTRTFTTLAVMQLVEKGDIKLTDNVSKYIKSASVNIPYNTTIKDLLSYTKPGTHELALADTLEIYNLDTEGTIPPLNTKFNLLGQVIEAVSGMDYAAYIKENITAPLDMQSTYTINEAGNSENITKGSRNYFGLPLKDNIENMDIINAKDESYWLGIPSNGLVSNVKDIGKYMQMYLSAGGKVISYNTMESIIGSKGEYAGKSIFGTDAYYSMGWIATETEGENVYYCNGSVENYTSAMFIIPSMDIGIVILFNSADALTGQKYTDIIEAGAVSLVMGKTAKAVSANSYLMEHGAADIIYFFAFVCSIMPLLMMEVWIRWTKDKFSIIRLLSDILLHIVIPTSLIFAIGKYIAPWHVVMKAVPDLFFVSVIVIGLFYLGLAVKIIAYIIIMLRKDRKGSSEDKEYEKDASRDIIQDNKSYIMADNDIDNNSNSLYESNIKEQKQDSKKKKKKKHKKENQEAEEEKEAKEKKEKLLKRIKGIKESEHTKSQNTEPEIITQVQEKQTTGQVQEDQENKWPQNEQIQEEKIQAQEEQENKWLQNGQIQEEKIQAQEEQENKWPQNEQIQEEEIQAQEEQINKPLQEEPLKNGQETKQYTDQVLNSGLKRKESKGTKLTENTPDITAGSAGRVKTGPGNRTSIKENTGVKTTKTRHKQGQEREKAKTRTTDKTKSRTGQDRLYNGKPKRFVVVNDSALPKNTKGSSTQDNKRNNSKPPVKNSTASKNRSDRNVNSTAGRKKSSYSNTGNKNNAVRENNKNNNK